MTPRNFKKWIGQQVQDAAKQAIATTLHGVSMAIYLVIGWCLGWLESVFSPPRPWNWMFTIGEWVFFAVFVFRLIAEVLFRRGRRPRRRSSRP